MIKIPDCAGIILSGGQNTRMNGRNKSFIKTIDPELHSFFNINTQEDLEQAQALLKNIFP